MAGPRRALVGDAAELARLRMVMLHAAGTEAPEGWAEEECTQWFTRRLADPNFCAYVVDDGRGHLLSCAVGQFSDRMPRPGQGPHVGEIASVATDPGHRRHGHARRVVEAVHQWLSANGCDRIHLTASPDGEVLYRSLGFAPPTGPVPLEWTAQ